MRLALALLAVAACSGNRSSKEGVTVELASVTLASDCGNWAAPPPPPEIMAVVAPREKTEVAASERPADEDRPAAAAKVGRSASQDVPARGAAGESMSQERVRHSCQQTSMQLYFRANSPTAVKIKSVELLDASGKHIQDLAVRAPTVWNNSSYVAWDEKVIGGAKQVSASYALATPDWTKLGGRMEAQTKTYHLRVVVLVGDAEHTLEKMSISPMVIEVRAEPDVVT